VGPHGRWFEPPAGDRVDLSARGPIRRILLRLVEQRESRPGTGVPLEGLVESGWPDEKIHPEAAASRVYTSIKTLRELGLGKHLMRRDDGYLLDPALVVARP
jgi:hypothetical protein